MKRESPDVLVKRKISPKGVFGSEKLVGVRYYKIIRKECGLQLLECIFQLPY